MLSKDTFVKSLGYLNAYYVNLKLDMNNEYVVAVWYEPFQTMDEQTFKNLVKSYAKSNVYAPSSPTSLLDFFRETMKLNELSGEQAWEIGYGKIKEIGFDVETAIKKLELDGKFKVANTLKEMKSSFRNVMTDQVPFIRKDFIRIYDRIVNQSANQLFLGNDDLLKLEKGEY